MDRQSCCDALDAGDARAAAASAATPPAAVALDGVHAAWLAGRSYRVHLVDAPKHVRATAKHGLVTAEVGDARRLTQAHESKRSSGQSTDQD